MTDQITTDAMPDVDPETWDAWNAANPHADEATALAALRGYIKQAALDAHASEPHTVTAAWLNKKLPALGVDHQLHTYNTYTLEVPVSAKMTVTVSAIDRDAALGELQRLADRARVQVEGAALTAAATFLSGPEDPTPGVLPDDAPATVDATLVKLRETVLLAVIAGPRVCVPGANDVLRSFGLGEVPDRQEFKVSVPVSGVAETSVQAYDELSALRVAQWRWDNTRDGFASRDRDVTATGDFTVTGK